MSITGAAGRVVVVVGSLVVGGVVVAGGDVGGTTEVAGSVGAGSVVAGAGCVVGGDVGGSVGAGSVGAGSLGGTVAAAIPDTHATARDTPTNGSSKRPGRARSGRSGHDSPMSLPLAPALQLRGATVLHNGDGSVHHCVDR
jgi:hypothetical protein